MAESLKKKTLKGTLWSVAERFSVQSVNFIVMIIMARILTKADYGLVGMLAIFMEVSQSLVDSGFSQALVRKQDRTQVDTSTAFYFNIVIGILLYCIIFVSAPLIARYYGYPILEPMARVLGLGIIVNSLVVVQRALLLGKLDFKTQAKASLLASIVAGVVGITMTYNGFGVWSLVYYQLLLLGINTGALWIVTKWHPSWVFSWTSFKSMFGFGSKLAISGLLETFARNLYLLVIGKKFAAAELGLYTRAQQFGNYMSANVSGILQRVSYPVLCSIQHDEQALRKAYRKFLRLSAFIIFPLMCGLAGISHPLIILLLTDQWEGTVPLLQILCLSLMWYPIHAINLNLLQVKGRSDLFLKLEIVKKFVGIGILFASLPFGIIAICWGQVINSLISLIINTFYTGKLIEMGFWRQMREILPSLLYSLSMGIVVFCIINVINNLWLQLILGILAGAGYYFAIAKLTRSADLRELLSFISKKV